MPSSKIPDWFAKIIADEIPLVQPKIEWDFSGNDIPKFNQEENVSLPTGFVKCVACIHCIPNQYKVMVQGTSGKFIPKRDAHGEVVYDIHCTKHDRRVTPWFTCTSSKIFHGE